jgi:hypothetical protein
LLSLPIIALLGAIILSATMRMKMYVHFYGLTTDRLYPLVFMAWLAIVLVWLALTVLRDWGQPFVAGATISGLIVLAWLNVWDPDAFVARVDIERAAHVSTTTQPALDLAHLAGLSGRAVSLATRATLAGPLGDEGGTRETVAEVQRCAAARTLLKRWGPTSPTRVRISGDAAWRFWNADDAAALRIVAAHTSDLIRVQHSACRTPPPELH